MNGTDLKEELAGQYAQNSTFGDKDREMVAYDAYMAGYISGYTEGYADGLQVEQIPSDVMLRNIVGETLKHMDCTVEEIMRTINRTLTEQ